MADKKISFGKFRSDLKADLAERLKGFGLSDSELEKYLEDEKDTISKRFRNYQEDYGKHDELTEGAFYKSCLDSLAYCLEMSYE